MSNNKMLIFTLFFMSIVFIMFGVIFGYPAIKMFFSKDKVLIEWKIIWFEIGYIDWKECFYPSIQYECSWKKLNYTTKIWTTWKKININETVELYCNPNQPDNVIMNNFGDKYLGLLFLFIWLLLLIINLFIIYFFMAYKSQN